MRQKVGVTKRCACGRRAYYQINNVEFFCQRCSVVAKQAGKKPRHMPETRPALALTENEVDRLIEHARPEPFKLIFRMMYTHGMRVSECLSITSAHIQGGKLVLPRLKNGNTPVHELSPFLRAELEVLAATKNPGARLFPFTRKWTWEVLQHAGMRAGVPLEKCHPHALRHGCGMRAAALAHPMQIKAFFGHRSLASTLVYTEQQDQLAISRLLIPGVK